MRTVHLTLALAASGALACGGSTPEVRSAADERPAPPPIPDDALQLLPAGAQQIARVDLAALQRSEHFPRLDKWARQVGCIAPSAPDHWLLRRSQQALLVTYAPPPERNAPLTVALVRGRFQDADATTALGEARRRLGADGPRSAEQRGRFAVAHAGGIAASVLDDRWLLLGDAEAVAMVLERLDARQRGPALADDPVLERAGGVPVLESTHIALVGELDGGGVRRVRRQLGRLGARRAGDGLAEGAVGATVTLTDGVRADLSADFSSGDHARASSRTLRGLFSRANLLMRLAGLGPILDGVEMRVEGAALHLGLGLGAGDTRRLARRLDAMISVMGGSCREAEAVAQRRPGPSTRR